MAETRTRQFHASLLERLHPRSVCSGAQQSVHTSPRVASKAHKIWLVWDEARSQQRGRGWRLPQLQWHGAAGSPRSSGCLSGSSGGNRAAFGLIITLSVLACTREDIPGPAHTLWNLGVVLGAIPSAKTKRVLSLKAISTLLSESYCFGGQEATTIFSTDALCACTTAHSSSFITSPCLG